MAPIARVELTPEQEELSVMFALVKAGVPASKAELRRQIEAARQFVDSSEPRLSDRGLAEALDRLVRAGEVQSLGGGQIFLALPHGAARVRAPAPPRSKRAVAPSNFFATLANRHPFVKLQAYGEPGSGKTWLLAKLAVGLWKRGGSVGEIAFLDSENAGRDVLPIFEAAGAAGALLYRQTRSLADLLEAMRLAREGAFSILVASSVTHFWEAHVELAREQLGLTTRSLSATERGEVKTKWRSLVSDPFREDPAHYLFEARATAEYETEVDQDTQTRQSFASGLRMRAEADTGYEGNIVVRLERRERREAGKLIVGRFAVVEKDRTGEVDGKEFENAKYADFEPAFERILARPQERAKVTTVEPPKLFHGPGSIRERENRAARKAIILEEQEAWLDAAFPGAGKKSVEGRAEALGRVFKTESKSFRLGLDLEVLEGRHVELFRQIMSLVPGAYLRSVILDGPTRAAPHPSEKKSPTSLAEALGQDLPELTHKADSSSVSAPVEQLQNTAGAAPMKLGASPSAAAGETPSVCDRGSGEPQGVSPAAQPISGGTSPSAVAGSDVTHATVSTPSSETGGAVGTPPDVGPCPVIAASSGACSPGSPEEAAREPLQGAHAHNDSSPSQGIQGAPGAPAGSEGPVSEERPGAGTDSPAAPAKVSAAGPSPTVGEAARAAFERRRGARPLVARAEEEIGLRPYPSPVLMEPEFLNRLGNSSEAKRIAQLVCWFPAHESMGSESFRFLDLVREGHGAELVESLFKAVGGELAGNRKRPLAWGQAREIGRRLPALQGAMDRSAGSEREES